MKFFTSGNVPQNLKGYTGLFSYFEMERQDKFDADFDEKALEKFSVDHQIPFYQNRRFWYYFTGVAASVLFLLTFLY